MNPILRHLRAVQAQHEQAAELQRLMDGASGGCIAPGSYVAVGGWARRTLHIDDDGNVSEHCSHKPDEYAKIGFIPNDDTYILHKDGMAVIRPDGQIEHIGRGRGWSIDPDTGEVGPSPKPAKSD